MAEIEEDFESNVRKKTKIEREKELIRCRVAPDSPEIHDDLIITEHIAYSGQSFESAPQQGNNLLLPYFLLVSSYE